MKKQRHEAIIRIIEQNCLSTQTELLDKLHEEGFNTTQATISRDIKDLRLVKKVDELGRSRYTVDSGESGELLGKYRSIFGHSVISADGVKPQIIDRGCVARIERADLTANFIRIKADSFIDIVYKKLAQRR